MKRFAMTISLAACLVFLCGSAVMAANLVTVESKQVAPNATGVTAAVWIENDLGMTAFVMPLEFREQTPGSYITTAFARGLTATGRMNNGPLGTASPCSGNAAPIQNRYPAPAAVGSCSPGPGNSYQSPAANVDFVSPDGTMLETHSIGDPSFECIAMAPGADPVGNPSYQFTFNVTGVVGTFIIDSTCTTPANHLGYVDENSSFVNMNFVPGIIEIFVAPNACPVINPAGPGNATVGAQSCVALSATDAEHDAIQFFVLSGPGTIVGNTVCVSPTCADVANGIDVVVYASDKGQGQCTSGSSQTTVHFDVAAAQLQITCGNVSVHWAAADATQDINAAGGCPPYVFSKISGVGSIDPASGIWTYNQGCSDVGSSPVTIRVTDANNAFVECTWTLTVTNQLPACAIIPQNLPGAGGVHSVVLGALGQADGDALTYTYVGGLPATWLDETISGNLFTATRPAGDGLPYTVTYTISDGCATVTCQFDVVFVNPCISIVDSRDSSAYSCWLNGQQATVCIYAQPGAIPNNGNAGGFDFLICYDQSGLSFLGASGGPDGWEYFTYRTGPFGGNCSGGCPDGYVHLVSIAESNNGVAIDPADFDLDGEILACLTFNVTSDRNFINSCLHVGFCSFDCGDNIISDVSGNVVWTPLNGVNLGPYYSCDGNNKPSDSTAPVISYCPGAICVCEPPDDRGDLNLNGIANEIGDAVLYTNYFIYGNSVWDLTWRDVQVLASDINDDGIVLTVADLIYLIRIITGDEQPFPPGTGNGSPKLSPYSNSVDVSNDVADGAITVRTNSSVEIGAALLVFRYSGSIGAPVLANNSGMEIRSNAANGELRVLVYSSVEAAASRLTSGSNSLVTVPVRDGSIQLVESQFSDYNGALLQVNAAAALPKEYALEQNYPNPFNAGTVIPFSLVEGSRYELSIYNVAGQVVRTFAGEGAAGLNRVEWNGRTADGVEAATGMYFYRVTTPSFTATKKMVLLK